MFARFENINFEKYEGYKPFQIYSGARGGS